MTSVSSSSVPGSPWHGHLTVSQAAAALAAALGLGLLFTLGIYCHCIRKGKMVESGGRTQEPGEHRSNESVGFPSPSLEEGSQGSERSSRCNSVKKIPANNDPYKSSETPGTLLMSSQMLTNLEQQRVHVPETIDMSVLPDTSGLSSEDLPAPQRTAVPGGCIAWEQPGNPVGLPCVASRSSPQKSLTAFQPRQNVTGLHKISEEKLSLKQKVQNSRLARLMEEQEVPGLPTGPSAASLAWDNSHDAVVTPGPKKTRHISNVSNSQPRGVRQLSTTSQPTSTSSAVSLAWDYTEETEDGLAKTWPLANQGIWSLICCVILLFSGIFAVQHTEM